MKEQMLIWAELSQTEAWKHPSASRTRDFGSRGGDASEEKESSPATRRKVIPITQNTDIPAVQQEYHLLIPYLIDKSSVQKAAWSWSPNFSLGRVDGKLFKLYKRTKDAETSAATKSPTEPLLILLLVNRPAP